jgi:hypothetical protein
MQTPTPNMLDRLKTAYAWGTVVGLWGIFFAIFEAITLLITEYLWPEQNIDVARNFEASLYNSQEDVTSFGDHMLYVDNTDKRSKKVRTETNVKRSIPLSRETRYSTFKPSEQQIIIEKPKLEVVIEAKPEVIIQQDEVLKQEAIAANVC